MGSVNPCWSFSTRCNFRQTYTTNSLLPNILLLIMGTELLMGVLWCALIFYKRAIFCLREAIFCGLPFGIEVGGSVLEKGFCYK
jgi:hypothetical protein